MEAGGSAELHPASVTDTHVQTGTLERAATFLTPPKCNRPMTCQCQKGFKTKTNKLHKDFPIALQE